MTRVIGLDPGSTESSAVRLSEDGLSIEEKCSAPNARVREWLHACSFAEAMPGIDGVVLAVEWMRPRVEGFKRANGIDAAFGKCPEATT